MNGRSDKPRVAILAGGLALERDVSLNSGQRVLHALQNRQYPAAIVDPDPKLLETLESFDVAFFALHGRLGEDGVLQSLLELMGHPFTGSGTLASKLAWDKPLAKEILRHAHLSTPDFALIPNAVLADLGGARAIDRVADVLGFPVVVKPAQGGSALGVQRVDTPDLLPQAVIRALAYSEEALIERHIQGTEVAVSILDGEPLAPIEIDPLGEFYDYAARYTAGATRFFDPPRLPPDVLDEVVAEALRAWDELGARHIGRVDLIVDHGLRPWILELSTCPGLTDSSVYPIAANSVGLGFDRAMEAIVEAALRDAGATGDSE